MLNHLGQSKPLKVALITPDFSGGGATRTYLLAQVLQKLNCEVKVFGFLFGQEIYPVPPSEIPIEWVKGTQYPSFLKSAQELVTKIQGDVIYAVKPKPTSLGIALLKKLKTKAPVLLDIDDWELSWFGGESSKYQFRPKQFARDILKKNGALRQPDHPLYLEWTERLIQYADAVTVNNQFLQNRFGGFYLPSGKDTDLFDPQRFDPQKIRQELGLSPYRILMFPGTARPHKGLEDVLEALEQLNQPDLRLVVVGGREIGDGYIERLMEQGKRWMIRLPQFPIHKMPEIVAAAHVIVVPQRDNPTAQAQFPIKLTDGMAMAKPILSTRVGDIPKILGDTGYLVEPRSPAQIAEKIQWIFNHPDQAHQQSQQARERCIQFYSTQAMAEILSNVIHDIFQEKQRGAPFQTA